MEEHYHDRHYPGKSGKLPTKYSGNAGIWDNTDWYALADEELLQALEVQNNVKKYTAKNVIMFIGDGMGVSTIAAARLRRAEERGLKGTDIYLTWERFPHVGLSRVSRSASFYIQSLETDQ